MDFFNYEKKGEITAFLSLTLLLILSLIGTVIEGGRVAVAKCYANRALLTSMDSVLAEYYYPLYEEYHLFLLDAGYGTNDMALSQMTDIMKEYMDFSLSPSKEINVLGNSVSMPNMDLYDISMENITIENTVAPTDYENKLFIHEAVGYMKYKTPMTLIEEAGKTHNYSKETIQSSEIIQKKMSLEETTCILSESMLDLIRYIEGLSVDKRGIHYTSNKLIKTEHDFVKKFCVMSGDSSSLQISHEVVFESLKSQYEYPINWLNAIIEDENQIVSCTEEIEQLLIELDSFSSTEGEVEDTNPGNNGSNNKKTVDKEKESLIVKRRQIIGRINALEREKQDLLQQIQGNVNKLIKLTKGTENKIKDALNVIPNIEKHQIEAQIEANEYGDYIEQKKAEIEEELYLNLKTDSNNIQGYINNLGTQKEYNLNKDRLERIKQALIHNQQVLNAVYGIEDIAITDSTYDISQMITYVTNLISTLNTYETKELWFDYSSLKIDPDVKNPVSYFNKLMEQGVLELVVNDLDSISRKEITSKNLPSMVKASGQEASDMIELSEEIGDCEKKGYQDELKTSFDDYKIKGEEVTTEINNSEQLIESLLLNEYMFEHFKSQQNSTLEKKPSETVLEYEQEYLLNGKLKDFDNYSDMVLKLILARTTMNYISLLTDSEKSGMAYATAASLVGFTCLEPLISLTKTVILLVWAYEEALVDTRGLLENKCIPLLKSKHNFAIDYTELLLMNKDRIIAKSQKLEKEKVNVGDMNYQDYIRLFLYLTNKNQKCERALDLMQENIDQRYEGVFLIKNCIFGYSVKVDFNIGAKFIKLPFVYKVLRSEVDGYTYSITRDYSY